MQEHLELFSNRLQRLIDQKNMKPADLAKAAGVSRGQISEALSGKRMPGRQTLLKIANALGVPLLTVMDGIKGTRVSPGSKGSAFAERELLEPPNTTSQTVPSHPLPPPAQQHMLSAAISVLESVQRGELPIPELDQAQALIGMVHPLRLKD